MQINESITLSIIFFVGLITVFIAFKIYDTFKTNYFRILYYYFLTAVILGFTYWIIKFAPGMNSYSQSLSFLRELFILISIPLIVLKIYFIYRFSVLLKDEKNSKILLYFYFFFWIILFLILLWTNLRSNHLLQNLIFKIVFHFQFCILLTIIIYLFVLSRSLKGKKWMYGIKVFSILLFIFTFLYYFVSMFYMSSIKILYIMLALFLAGQLIPVLYLGYFVYKNPDALPQLYSVIDYKKLFLELNISIREQDVFLLLIQGKSNKEIEEKLFISIHTVKAHIQNIYKKTGVKKRTHLINFTKKYLY